MEGKQMNLSLVCSSAGRADIKLESASIHLQVSEYKLGHPHGEHLSTSWGTDHSTRLQHG